MRFDMSGMSRAFDKLAANAQKHGKDLAQDQARFFLSEIKKDGRAIAPTPDTIVNVTKRLGWRLKRKPGVSPQKELARRIRAIGTFARGWKLWKTETDRNHARIWLIDMGASSEKVDNLKGVSDKAIKASGGRFKQKLDQLANKLCTKF